MHQPQIEDALQPDRWPLRLCRSASAALVCTLLAAGAHVAAGGDASEIALGGLFATTWLVSATLTGRRLTTSQLVGLLIIAQADVHLVCASTDGSSSDITMLATHVVGTALCAWMLRRGEDSLWTLAERVGLRAVGITTTGAMVPARRGSVPVVTARAHPRLLLAHVIEGRGPPVGLV